MNKKSAIISAVAGLVAVLATWMFINSVIQKKIGDYIEEDAIVATQDIPQNTRITENMLAVVKVPRRFLQPGRAKTYAEILKHYATSNIIKGEQILATKLAPVSGTNLSLQIPPGGYRAVTIGVQDAAGVASVGGLVKPGNFVDILLTLSMNTQAQARDPKLFQNNKTLRTEVRTLFQNVRVLAVGHDYEVENSPIRRNIDSTTQERRRAQAAKNVTVALRPRDAQVLILAQTVGRITLALRRFRDDELAQMPIEDPISAFDVKLPLATGPVPTYMEYHGGRAIQRF